MVLIVNAKLRIEYFYLLAIASGNFDWEYHVIVYLKYYSVRHSQNNHFMKRLILFTFNSLKLLNFKKILFRIEIWNFFAHMP